MTTVPKAASSKVPAVTLVFWIIKIARRRSARLAATPSR